jgi:3-hydroxymyristoyl/3-hydroxydecanoyl-(acyl carrier protein) dehydratase
MTAELEHETSFDVEADHPSLPGHFPGEPILPGVVVLDRALEAAEAWLGSALLVTDLAHVKFVSPLRPGDRARLHLRLDAPSLRFEVRNGETLVAKGAFSVRIVPDKPA